MYSENSADRTGWPQPYSLTVDIDRQLGLGKFDTCCMTLSHCALVQPVFSHTLYVRGVALAWRVGGGCSVQGCCVLGCN